MPEVLSIDRRFHSWEGVAHGGYVAGQLARRVGPACEVSLRQAVPFDTPMRLSQDSRGRITLGADGTVMARAEAADVRVEVPAPVCFAEAAATAWNHVSIPVHPTPTCFCCGYERVDGDGLRIWPGSLPGRDTVAAAWIPHPSFAGDHGTLDLTYVWAALDCPSFWGIVQNLQGMPNVVTIRMAGSILGPVRVERPHVVLGWPIEHGRRRMIGGSAIFGPDGDLLAASRVTWLEVRDLPEA
jgi:acyl-coenzyme A thioesterase PaaI-like protein